MIIVCGGAKIGAKYPGALGGFVREYAVLDCGYEVAYIRLLRPENHLLEYIIDVEFNYGGLLYHYEVDFVLL